MSPLLGSQREIRISLPFLNYIINIPIVCMSAFVIQFNFCRNEMYTHIGHHCQSNSIVRKNVDMLSYLLFLQYALANAIRSSARRRLFNGFLYQSGLLYTQDMIPDALWLYFFHHSTHDSNMRFFRYFDGGQQFSFVICSVHYLLLVTCSIQEKWAFFCGVIVLELPFFWYRPLLMSMLQPRKAKETKRSI